MDEIKEALDCIICYDSMLDPMLCIKCGINICKTCLDEIKQTSNPKCPNCRNSDFVINKFLNRFMENIELSCKICGYLIKSKEFKDHQQVCNNNDKIYCNICLDKHYIKEKCMQTKCGFCKKYVNYQNLTQHHNTMCMMLPINCSNCSGNMLKKDFDAHSKNCFKSNIKCKYCDTFVLNINNHIKQCSHKLIRCNTCGNLSTINDLHICEWKMCNKCKQKIKLTNFEHHNVECLENITICQYCHKEFKIRLGFKHQLTCKAFTTCRVTGKRILIKGNF